LVAHIEGGEISGNIDEHIRHSISKLSHIHFVSNQIARDRVIKMGEIKKNVFVVGSPDIDIMSSKKLPQLNTVKKRYGFTFENYGILILHPVTSEIKKIKKQADIVVKALVKSNQNFVVIFPNNDPGNEIIINTYKKLNFNLRFKIIKSMRFEYFLTLLKNSSIIIGNSSSGVIEAPFYGIQTINLGNRQNNRSKEKSIINISFNEKKILKSLKSYLGKKYKKNKLYGNGNSDTKIIKILKKKRIWLTPSQKTLSD
jgi:UDP-N-acetylglucosamine 2-epimerase (hydrolysing)